MYQSHFGLEELPFNVTPDPRFLYLNDCYQEAIAALTYGIDGRKGFVTLVGEAGTGKTTLLRRVLDTLDPKVRSVLLLHPTVSFDEILAHILGELGLATDGGKLVRLHRLHDFLLDHTRQGGNVTLLIDEAQDLDPTVLEELRLLSNLETGREKILQIVLAGQPELDARLADPGLRQLRQRITLRVRIRPLSAAEVAAYVQTRLDRAGASDASLFTKPALDVVAEVTGGIPRVVNVLCDACLVHAFAAGATRVTPAVVREAWADYAATAGPGPAVTVHPAPPPLAPVVAPVRSRTGWGRGLGLAAAVVAVAGGGSVLWEILRHQDPAPSPPAAIADAAVPVAPPPPAAVAPELPAAPPTPVAEPAAVPPPTVPVVAAARPPALEPPPAPPLPDGPISVAEAAAAVEAFGLAYQARDADALAALFAADARVNQTVGSEAIAAFYRQAFARWRDAQYAIASLQVVPKAPRAIVTAPFTVRYETRDGAPGVLNGVGEWQVDRRDGRPMLTAFAYRFVSPPPPPVRRTPEKRRRRPRPAPPPAETETPADSETEAPAVN